MKANWNRTLPVLLMVVFALTRWPGVMPLNFSAAYALSFCAGVYFPGRLAYCLPLATLALSDLALNCYYYFAFHIDSFSPLQLVNYGVYVGMIWLGRRLGARAGFGRLVTAGLLGAVVFYIVTNTAAWFFNPFGNAEYTRTVTGWWIALTRGTAGYPETWQFFRNTLLSGGLFTALFVGAMKLTEESEPLEAPEAGAESDPPAGEESRA